ncbi:MAG: DNA translocase FtsK 4TM domain-containing protein, partial [Bilifractor sp.]
MAQSKGRKRNTTAGSSTKGGSRKTSGAGKTKNSVSAASGRNKGGRSRTAEFSASKSSRKNNSRTAASASDRSTGLKRDVGLLFVLGLSILMFLSCIGLCGPVGSALAFVLFGLFGAPAYIFPFILFYLVLFVMANPASPAVARRVAALTGLYIFICAFVHLLFSGYEKGIHLGMIFRENAHYHTGGG